MVPSGVMAIAIGGVIYPAFFLGATRAPVTGFHTRPI
jgi:hypothetical protein